MLAPRRVPPCLTASVAPLKTRRKLTGPLALPPVECTSVSLGRRREKAKPVPPPLLWMMAAPLDGLEDLVHRVADRQHEARRELQAVVLAGVHQRRGVGQESPVHHHLVEATGDLVDLLRRLPPGRLGGGDGMRNAPAHVLGRLASGDQAPSLGGGPVRDRSRYRSRKTRRADSDHWPCFMGRASSAMAASSVLGYV